MWVYEILWGIPSEYYKNFNQKYHSWIFCFLVLFYIRYNLVDEWKIDQPQKTSGFRAEVSAQVG